MPSSALALAHRAALIDLSVLTTRDVLAVWRLVSGAPAGSIRDALMEVVPGIGEQRGDMAGSLAADFYEDVRDEVGVRGRFVAEPVPGPHTSRYEALVRWGVDPLGQRVPDEALTFSRVAGGLQKIVATQARETLVRSTERDPAAKGWRRVASSSACKFCRMLAGRGAVYSSSSVRFAAHDWCGCAAVPAFDAGRPASVEQYTASKRSQSAADRENTRRYISGMSDKPREPEQRVNGFDALSRQQLEHQLLVLEGMPDSDYRTGQMTRVRARLAELAG